MYKIYFILTFYLKYNNVMYYVKTICVSDVLNVLRYQRDDMKVPRINGAHNWEGL